MKKRSLAITSLFLFFAFISIAKAENIHVKNLVELNQAIEKVEPGDEIVMADGIWENVQINFYGKGTSQAPITLRAETSGKVFIEGQSFLHLGGEYLIVDGLYFRNGYAPAGGVIRYKVGKDKFAFHSRVTNCVVNGFTRPNRWENDRWIEFYGKHNQMDHCYIAGKGNDGVTLMIYHDGNENTNNHHQIVYNFFGPRPRKGGPRAETVRLGGSETSMTPGYANISNNYFEACNGEVEIISDKTNHNSFKNNIFYKCEGSLVLRHGNYATVDGNMFIGDDDSDFYGGIRLVNTGHWITNNYFYKIRGEQFRSPLAVMNGIPKSSLNRYKQVTDAVVAYNTWIDCKSPLQIGVGQNNASANVLPKSEIRSAPPIRTTIANNIVYNTQVDNAPIVEHDDMSGVLFKNNVLDNGGVAYTEFDVLNNQGITMEKVNDWLYIPTNDEAASLDEVFVGYEFEKIKKDLFGSSRAEQNKVGAIGDNSVAENFKIDKSKFGPSWFQADKKAAKSKVYKVSSSRSLLAKLKAAKSGDILELTKKNYRISGSLKIDKEITIRSKGKATLVFKGDETSPAFEINSKANIKLENVIIKGNNSQTAFAPLKENMFAPYFLSMKDCEIKNFTHVLKATKGSFADSISVKNTVIKDCTNGFVLAADQKGDYNAEMVSFKNCKFENIKNNVIHFFRGGYDESTIGGCLSLAKNKFTNCGNQEKSKVLIKTRGIINVNIKGNTFKDNPVDFVAVLWGAKNNHHKNNSLENSGEIKVEEQQKLDILY